MKKLLPYSLLVMMFGCATPGIDRADENQIIKEFYATIVDVTPVELSSQAGTGTAIGAGVGLVENLDGDKEDMIGGAIIGALLGGIFTSIAEGSDHAYQYSLRSEQEGTFTLIQKKLVNEHSRCVRVRMAKEVILYAAPISACQLRALSVETSAE